MINGKQDKPKSKNKIADFASKAFGDTTTEQSDSTDVDQKDDPLLNFAKKGFSQEPESVFKPNPNAIHPPTELDPTQNESLTETQRAALDIAMIQNLKHMNSAAGYMPQSELFSARNAFMKGMGGFFSGIGSFASAAWREATFKEQFAKARGDEPTAAEDEPLYRLGQSIKNGIEEIFPENPEYQGKLASKFARSAGTLGSQVITAGLTGGGSAIVQTGIMASSFSGMEYEQVLEQTGDDDLAFQTALLNLPVNGLEAIPVLQALSRTDKLTGGMLRRTIKGATRIGVQEALQETGQAAASNWIASNMYDETRKITDGMAEGGAMGFVLGGLLGGSTIALQGRAIDPTVTPVERAEARQAYRLGKGELERLDMTEQMFRRTFPETMQIIDPVEEFAAMNKFAPADYDVDSKALVDEPILDGSVRMVTEPDQVFRTVFDNEFDAEVMSDKTNTWSGELLVDQIPEYADKIDTDSDYVFVQPSKETLRKRFPDLDPKKMAEEGVFVDDTKFTTEDFGFVPIYTKKPKGKRVLSDNTYLEKVENTPNRMNKKATLVPEEKSKKGWLQRFVPWFQDKGEFSPNTRKILRDNENLNGEFRADIRLYANDMKNALRSHYGLGKIANPFISDKIPTADLRAIDNYMQTGKGFRKIPEALRLPVKNLRMHIDKMTKAAIQVGLFEGDVKTTVQKNIGSYIYRTYKKHQYPEAWAKKVPAEVRNSAKFWLQSQYQDAGYKPTEAEMDEVVRQLLLTDDSPTNILSSNPEVRKRVADLKGRTQFRLKDPNDPTKTVKKFDEIPKPIQELWGVETNPFINYLNSVSKIATLTTNHKTLAELKRILGPGAGKNQMFFDPKDTPAEVKSELDLRVLTKDDNIAMAPLDGMWTTPEMKQALLKMNEGMRERSRITNLYIKGNSIAKLSTTVLSPRTFFRNFVGSYLFLPAQGHVLPTNNRQAIDNTLAIFRNPDSPANRAELKMLSRLGMMERSPRGSEMKALVQDFKGKDSIDRNLLDNLAGGRTKNIAGLIEKGVMKASDAYQLGDTFFRMQLFYLEKARYQRKGIDVTNEQIAEIVHNTYQDYSRSSKGIRNLRKNIIFAPFITFHSEVVRTAGNTVRQFKHEIKSSNPKIREIGYERMAGFMLFAGLGSAATASIFQYLFGVADETVDALREWSAPWNKKATLVPLDVHNGGGRYVNLTYTDPYEIIKQPIYEFVRSGDEESFYDNALQATFKFLEPATSPELFAKATAEAFMGRKFSGTPLIRQGDSKLDQYTDRFAHVFSSLEPGAVDQIGQAYESLGEPGPWAKVQAFSAFMGQNIVKIDVREQIPYAVRNYQRENRALRSSYLATAREGSYEDNLKELDRVNAQKEKNFEAMIRKMDAAFHLGLDYNELKSLMNDANMSEEDIDRIWSGNFEPFEMHVPEPSDEDF